MKFFKKIHIKEIKNTRAFIEMKKYFFFTFFLTISGCMVGPNYKTPKVDVPENYIEKNNLDESAFLIKDWWKSFDDQKLNELIEIAIESNYSFKVAIERIEEARAFLRLKKADLFPEIDLNAKAARQSNSQNYIYTSFLPEKIYDHFQFGFDAIWELDLFGRLRREKEAAFYGYNYQIENMKDVYITLTSDVARYYIDVCSIQNIIILIKKKIELKEKKYTLSSNLNITGLQSKIIEDRLLTDLKIEQENLLFYETLLKQTLYKLATLLGKYPEDLSDDLDSFSKVPQIVSELPIGLPSTILRRRPDIKMAEYELAKATALTGAAIARYFPTFALTGTSELSANDFSKLFTGDSILWNIGALLKWPVITFGRIKSDVEQKKSQTKQAMYLYENTIINAFKDVESALVAYFNEKLKLNKIEDEVSLYSNIASLEDNKYQNGIIDLTQSIDANIAFIEKKVKNIESKRALFHNLIAVYKSLGPEVCFK